MSRDYPVKTKKYHTHQDPKAKKYQQAGKAWVTPRQGTLFGEDKVCTPMTPMFMIFVI